MVTEMKSTKTEIEQLLLEKGMSKYGKLKTGRQAEGFVLIARGDGGCNVCYQYATDYYQATAARWRKREEALKKYLNILGDAGYTAVYVPENGLMDDTTGPYTQQYIACQPKPVLPFIWYEEERNSAYNAAPEDAQSYIEALEHAVREAIQFRLHSDKDHAKRLYDAVKLLNFLKEGE